MTHRVILDLDTGIDDAIALILAQLSEEIQVLGVTTVSGNCPVSAGVENTLRVLDALGFPVPVFRGMAHPVVRPYYRSDDPKDDDFLDLPAARSQPRPEHAVDWLISTLLASDEPITLVCLAPLTNVADAIRRAPTILSKIQELVIMGGGHAVSNMTPSSEFNIWVDAEAAKLVMACGRPIRLVTLDATHQACITRSDVDRVEKIGSQAGRLLAHLLRSYIAAYALPDQGGAPMHDPLALCAVLKPQLLGTQFVHVDVETRGELTYGRTVCDLDNLSKLAPNVSVALSADGPNFVQTMMQIVGGV